MTSFHNFGEVQHQVAHQIIHGDVHHNTHYVGSSTDPTTLLDSAILESLSFPQMTDRRRNVDPPHHRTCQWIFHLEKFRTWNTGSSGLLWIKGKPGAGKSTLMLHLYHDVCRTRAVPTDNKICLEFFFSARGAPLQRSFLGMLRSLSCQIFKNDNANRAWWRTSYEDKQESFGRGKRGWEWQQPELMSLFLDMVLISAKARQIVLFVDALDEAGEREATDIASFLHSLNDRALECSANVRICISCRHYPVSSFFPAVEIHVEDHNHSDIQDYVQDRLPTGLLCGSNDSENEEWKQLVKNVADRAAGIFQWVCLVTPMMAKHIRDGDSLKEVKDHLSQVPTGLKQVYEHILKNVIDRKHRARSLRLFRWVCSATRPLSVTELRYALAAYDTAADPLPHSRCSHTTNFAKTDEVMRLRIRSWSGGLIEVVTTDEDEHADHLTSIVQLIHQSVNDFLMTYGFNFLNSPEADISEQTEWREGADISAVSDIVAVSHGELYRCCLSYLASETTRLASFRIRGLLDREKEREDEFPLVRYATSNLLAHAGKAHGSRNIDVKRESQLLEYILQTWLSIWNAMFKDSAALKYPATTLHVAAVAGLDDLAIFLLEHGSNVRAVDIEGYTALHLAAYHGRLSTMKLLTDFGADIHATTRFEQTALILAASGGFVEAFSWLCKRTVNPKDPTTELEEALYSAASRGSTAVLGLCIEAGADLNWSAGVHGSPLTAASYMGHNRVVKLLLDKGVNINGKAGSYGTALSAASYMDHTEIVQLLLDRGADVNAVGGDYGNALSTAAYRGHVGVVELLLGRGADVNAPRGVYGDALSTASYRRHEEVVETLLDGGADIDAARGVFGTALSIAAYRGLDSMIELLLHRGANINQLGGRYGSPLAAACWDGNGDTVRLLLNKGANVNARGGKCGSPLHTAAAGGQKRVVQQLLDHGADVNAFVLPSGTPLMLAAAKGYDSIIQVLLDHGADVNVLGGRHGSALSTASNLGNFSTVEMLLLAGADVNARTGRHGTALETALRARKDLVAHLLLSYGAARTDLSRSMASLDMLM